MSPFQTFLKDQRGATAMMFALSVVPLMGLVGAAVDYSRATDVSSHLQKAVDATALALVRDAARLNNEALKQKGRVLFDATFAADNQNFNVQAFSVTKTDKTIKVAAEGTMRTAIMQVMGYTVVPVHGNAEVAWGSKKIELALALDNTGSMSRLNKMPALKEAAHDLLTTLERVATDRDMVKVSIVPFDTQVRLDANTYRNASWLDTVGTSRAAWDGYVEERSLPNDVSDAAPDRIRPETLYPMMANAEGAQLATMQPLTSDFPKLHRTVDSMNPRGCTNVTLGASWGLATLSANEPLTEASAGGGKDVEKIMILLTDGLNTRSRFFRNAGCDERTEAGAQIDQRTELACSSVKAAGVRLYTIRVIEGNEIVLKGCASTQNGKQLYYNVQNASELKPVFQAIADEILSTRLTH